MNGPDWNQLLFYASVISLVISVGNMAYTWISSRDRVTDKRFKELESDFQELQLEHAALKGRVDALPNEARFDGIAGQVGKLDGDMKEANEKLKGLDKRLELLGGTAQRIEQFLLDNSGGKRRR